MAYASFIPLMLNVNILLLGTFYAEDPQQEQCLSCNSLYTSD